MSLQTIGGAPVHDKGLAVRIADAFSEDLEKRRNAELTRMIFGDEGGRTLERLLKRLHEDRGPRWSDSHARDQDRFRKFWMKRIGGSAKLHAVNAAMVESIVERESRERGWSRRTEAAYLRYIVDAYYYAERKLKWIEPRHNLSAVDIPSPDSDGTPYTLAQVRKLLPALETTDEVAGWIGHVLWQTGRRLSAVRTLPKSAVTVHEDLTEVRWPEETDKAGRGGLSVIVGRAHELTRKLMKKPGKYVAGAAPPSLDTCIKEWLPAAEEAAGIEHVDGRAWHGVKRRYSDRTEGMKGRASQAGTRDDTLRRVYDPEDDLEAMRRVAERLAGEVR